MIVAAADGSALGNPGPAGWCWFIDTDRWAAGGWAHGTNNMGELMAVLDLLRATAGSDEPLLVLCDSQYVINAITKWMANWKRRGWKKADGKPVLNQELLRELDIAMTGRTVDFQWVKGHAGHALNEAADERARAAASAYQRGGRPDPGPGFGGEPVAGTPAPVGDAPGESEPEALFALEPTDTEQVVAAERELLDPAVRGDVGRLAALLAPEWVEIGASGRLWNRADMIDALAADPACDASLELLEARPLGQDVMLLVWRAVEPGESRLRSSVWRRTASSWRQVFAQGTREP
ncbi:RNase H family protein [Naumannella huperziae]